MRLAQRTQQVVIQGYSDQGAWLITTGYVVDDLVNDGGVEYVCIVAHTSTAADQPGVLGDHNHGHHVSGGAYRVQLVPGNVATHNVVQTCLEHPIN